MSYQDDVASTLSVHVGSLDILDLGDEIVKPGADLARTLSIFTSIAPYIPSSVLIQSVLVPQRPDLVCEFALVKTIFPFC